MSDRYTPDEGNSQAPDAAQHVPLEQAQDAQPAQPVPVEQPYYVPTAHQQAWSVAQQYPGQPYSGAQYGQAYAAPAYPGQPYAGQPYADQPYPGQPYAGQPYPMAYGYPAAGGWGGGQPPSDGAVASAQPWQGEPGGPGWGYAQYWTPPPVAPAKRGHRVLLGSVAAATATALAVGGIALAVDRSNHGSSQQTALTTPNSQLPFAQNGTGSGSDGSGSDGSGSNGISPYGNGFGGSGSGTGSGSGATGATGTATSAQQVGVVDINTTLDYDQGKAAGTGLVLTSGGEILTNNHVVQDSTAISVTVVSTGKTYTATVVGTDPTDDIAVIELKNASGLATAKLGDSSKVAVGTAVTAVGNAGGTGGTPSSASGSVTALNQSITASDTNGSNAEKLTGMFEVNAAIQAGDSGGPLYDNASGSVIGIDTAASSAAGGRFGARSGASAATTGFAIPIAKALSIAGQITGGKASSTIHLGYPAFFGVQLSAAAAQATSGGAPIDSVVSGSAADKAGLAAGDTITSVDGKAVASASALSTVTASHHPGDKVTVGYTDSSGQQHSVSVTLGSGPAD